MSTAALQPKTGSSLADGTSIGEVLVSGIPNGTLAYNYDANGISTPKPKVNDASFDQDIRIAALYIFIVLGSIGGALVLLWLWFNRRRKSRVNALILHVCMSDLLVIFGACLPQLIWEYSSRHWALGDAVCRILKFLQSFVMMSSNYMLVVLSIDRHQAIRSPLREPFKVSICYFYRLQTKFANVMFLHLSVSHSVHTGGCIQGGLHPGKGLHPGGLHPGGVGQTPQIGYYGIWSTSGWYVSYRNVFLLRDQYSLKTILVAAKLTFLAM